MQRSAPPVGNSGPNLSPSSPLDQLVSANLAIHSAPRAALFRSTETTVQTTMEDEMEIRKEEKMDSDRRTAHGAGMEAKLDVGDTPAREAMQKARGRPFERGRSGNPNGRPKGHRNKATMAIEELLDGEAERLTRKVIEKALDGDTTALRLCVDRLLAPRRERPITFDLPKIESAADAKAASSAILAACAAGTLSPGEAAAVMELVSNHVRMFEMSEIEARVFASPPHWRRHCETTGCASMTFSAAATTEVPRRKKNRCFVPASTAWPTRLLPALLRSLVSPRGQRIAGQTRNYRQRCETRASGGGNRRIRPDPRGSGA
jgi:hypothetical protein